MKVINDLIADTNQIFLLTKVFYRLNNARAHEQTSGFSLGRILKVLVSIYLIFAIFLSVWVLVLFVVPPIPEIPSIKLLFGSGLNLVAFFSFCLFLFSALFRFFHAKYFFQDSNTTTKILIRSSPISLSKLSIAFIFSGGIIESFYCISTFAIYLMYRTIKGLPIDFFYLPFLLLYSLIISFSGAIIGFYIQSLLSARYEGTSSQRNAVLIISFIIFMILALIIDIFSKTFVFQFFSPLGWISLGIYSIFSGNNKEYLLTIFPSFLFLFSLLFLQKGVIQEESNPITKGFQNQVTSIPFRFFQSIVCGLFSEKKRRLAELLFIEDWEQKRPLKFLIIALPISLLLIAISNLSFSQFPNQIQQAFPKYLYIFSIIGPLVPLIHNEIGFSFFYLKDDRFSFYRSTPLGIRPITQIRLYFIFIWEIPILLLIGLMSTLIFGFPILTFLLALGVGILATSLAFYVQCYRPKYYIPNMLQGENILLTLLILGVVNLLLSLPMMFDIDLISPNLANIIYFFCAIFISLIVIEFSIQKLERTDILV